MLQVQNVFISPTRRKADAVSKDVVALVISLPSSPLQATAHRRLSVYEGDHLTLLNIYRAFVNVSEFSFLGVGQY